MRPKHTHGSVAESHTPGIGIGCGLCVGFGQLFSVSGSVTWSLVCCDVDVDDVMWHVVSTLHDDG